ncbi:hypothetical protein CLOM_g12715, partial [Closterium sp. NIES-68]
LETPGIDDVIFPESLAVEPAGLSSLASLHILTLDLNLQQLSRLVHLPRLTELSVSDNTNLVPSDQRSATFAITQLPHLKSLRIEAFCDQFNLTTPSGLPCTRLEGLLIANSNNLETLPDNIGEMLPCLRELTVESCKTFSHLPKKLTSMSRLESLTVSCSNLFFSLPENIALPALKTLVLHLLPLAHLPGSLCHLSNLETLFLIGCGEIHQLPADFCNLTALRTLCLQLPLVPFRKASDVSLTLKLYS